MQPACESSFDSSDVFLPGQLFHPGQLGPREECGQSVDSLKADRFIPNRVGLGFCLDHFHGAGYNGVQSDCLVLISIERSIPTVIKK